MQKNWRLAYYQNYLNLLKVMWQKREDIRAYTGILLSLFAVTFFGIFAIRPTLKTIGELTSQIRGQKEIVATLDQKINSLETAQKTWQEITPHISILNQALPEIPNAEIFIRQVETFALQENLIIQDLSLGKLNLMGETGDGLKFFTFLVAVQGEPEKVFSFSEKLQNLRRVFVWQTVVLGEKKEKGQSTSSGKLTLTIGGGVPYFLK